MNRSIRRRLKRAGATAGAAAVAVSLLITGDPADAQVPTDYMMLTGNFVGDARDEVFYYTPGAGPEGLAGFFKDTAGTAVLQPLAGEYTANGAYVPLVGDYDADGYDEILWFSPGTGGDSMWHFNNDGTVRSVAYRINGIYSRPVVGDFTADGADDILWYEPGAYQDVMWDFNPGGGYSSTARTINGAYTPISGSFGNDATDDILWYFPGATLDPMWDHVPGSTSYTQQVHNIRGSYTPVVVDMFGDGAGNEDIFWYGPGTYPDSTWDFYQGQYFSYPDLNDGEYAGAAGDFFGDGVEDIAWDNSSELVIWNHTPDYVREAWFWPKTEPTDATASRSAVPQDGPTPATDTPAEGGTTSPLPRD